MPAPLHYLNSSDKVVLTPHIAGWTKESYYKLSDVLADKILEWINPDRQ
jgi:D-3-phosphoglycerate dehydrogenase